METKIDKARIAEIVEVMCLALASDKPIIEVRRRGEDGDWIAIGGGELIWNWASYDYRVKDTKERCSECGRVKP